MSGRERRGINTRLWIGVAVSVLCIVLVSRGIDWTTFGHAVAGAGLSWIAGGVLLNVASYVCAGFRFRQVIAPQAPMTARNAYDAVVIGNLATLVAPSRAGDFAKAAFVSRKQSIPVSRVLGAIAIERFGDITMLILLALALWSTVPFPAAIRAGVIAFAAAGIAAMAALFLAADWLPRLAGRIVGVVSLAWGHAVRSFLDGIFSGVRSAGSVRRFPGTLAWSVAIWTLSGGAFWCVLQAFALPVPWYAAFFVLMVVNLGGVIPASPGSIGVFDYLAMIALAVWAVNVNVALGFAIVAHVSGLLVILLLGLGGLTSQHESLFMVRRSVTT